MRATVSQNQNTNGKIDAIKVNEYKLYLKHSWNL